MGTTTFVWDPVFDCVSHELDENNDVKAVYNNEPQQYGGVLSQRRGTTSHYHHHDALGSTRFLTDSSGTVTDTYLHDAWGNSVATTGTTVNPFKWVGKYGYYTDNSTGLVYVRARTYQPTVARWASIYWRSLSTSISNNTIRSSIRSMVNPMAFQPPSTSSPAPAGCTVRLRCIKIVWPFAQHCGVEVEWPGGSTDYYHVMDKSGNSIPTTCDYSAGGKINPSFGGNWWTEATWTLTSSTMCDCFKRQATTLNAEKLPYEMIPNNYCDKSKDASCNSNYAAKCMLGHCGLKYSFDYQIDPVGWNLRRKKCLKQGDSAGTCAPCSCDLWSDPIDSRYCGDMAHGNIGPDPK